MPSSRTRTVRVYPDRVWRTYPSFSRVYRMREAVGRGRPARPASSARVMSGLPGSNARMRSRPRATASTKFGLVSRRGMGFLRLAEATTQAMVSAVRTEVQFVEELVLRLLSGVWSGGIVASTAQPVRSSDGCPETRRSSMDQYDIVVIGFGPCGQMAS